MKKTPSKKIVKKQLDAMSLHTDADVKRYVGFVNEVHGDNLKALGEGMIGINERFDRMDVRLDSMDERFDRIDERFNRVGERFDRIDQRFNGVDVRLNEHSEILGRLLLDVEEIKSGLKLKVDREDFSKLEKRMVALEAFVFGGQNKQKAK